MKRLSIVDIMPLFKVGDPPPEIIQLSHMYPMYGPFGVNHLVPWFKFSNGELRNAGQLSTYWGMPGVRLDQAINYAKWDANLTDKPV